MSKKNDFVTVFCAIFMITLIVGVESSISTTTNQVKTKIKSQQLMHELQKQIKNKEDELRNAEEINRNFERMIQFVNILGQVDNFLTERTKGLIKKLAVLVEDEDDIKRRFRNYISSEEEN